MRATCDSDLLAARFVSGAVTVITLTDAVVLAALVEMVLLMLAVLGSM